MTLVLTVKDDRFDTFWIEVEPSPSQTSQCKDNLTKRNPFSGTVSFICDKLNSMTNYTFTVGTKVANIKSDSRITVQNTGL